MKPVAFAFAAFCLSTAAFAEGETNQPAQAGSSTTSQNEQAAEEKAERKICRRVEGMTGSRLGSQRVCLTREQWRAMGDR